MTDRPLTLRELNRTTLSRQMLLQRSSVPATEAIERLVGLQAQVPAPPYVGLWTRLEDFRREDLSRLLEERQVVRAALMRSTLHLMTARDYLLLRPALQPALTRALSAFFGKRAKDLDIDRLVAAARPSVGEQPRTTGELRAFLSELEPDRDPEAMAYAVRAYLPMVQVPTGDRWGYSTTSPYALAETWLGRPLSGETGLRELVYRYLAAFGPASVKDVQAWSGMVRLKEPVENLKPELRSYRDEGGNELLDLPDVPSPREFADAPAPVRFLPDYDNLLLAHADRTRVIADEHRPKVFLSAARVRATFLVDGFVRGAWKIEKSKRAATLVIEPFERLSRRERDALAEEGERLVRFAAEPDGVGAFTVRFKQTT